MHLVIGTSEGLIKKMLLMIMIIIMTRVREVSGDRGVVIKRGIRDLRKRAAGADREARRGSSSMRSTAEHQLRDKPCQSSVRRREIGETAKTTQALR